MLSPRQKRFAAEYAVDCCAAKAAVRAGYSPKWAGRAAHRLMQLPEVQAELAAIRERLSRETEITVARTLLEFAKVAFANVGAFGRVEGNQFVLDLSRATADDWAAVSEITSDEMPGGVWRTKIKLHPKIPALEAIAKHLGMFTDTRPQTPFDPGELYRREAEAMQLFEPGAIPASKANGAAPRDSERSA